LVTLITLPPRPPLLAAPQPSAPGKALSWPVSEAAGAAKALAENASSQPQATVHTTPAFILDSFQLSDLRPLDNACFPRGCLHKTNSRCSWRHYGHLLQFLSP
jgi:hypothetical protein